MKTDRKASALTLALLFAGCAAMAEKPFDPNDYKPCEFNAVRSSPEDFKNKQVSLLTVFIGLRSDFPPFMEDMGFKDDKYFLVATAGFRGFQGGGLPVIAKKSEFKDSLPSLRQGAKVAIYGKVKKFQHSFANRNTPEYYLDVDKVEEIDAKSAKGKDIEKGVQQEEKSLLDDSTPKPPKDFGKPRK